MIPPATVTLPSELRRVIAEETRPQDENNPDPHPELRSLLEKVDDFVAAPSSASAEERPLWLRLLTFVAVDLIMDLGGKLDRARLVAIAPVKNLDDPKNPVLHQLPGGWMEGFGGFTSPLAGRHEVAVARYCAQLFLEKAGVIRSKPLGRFPQMSKRDQADYTEAFKEGMDALAERVGRMMRDSHFVNLFPGLDQIINRIVASRLKSAVAGVAAQEEATETFQFRIEVIDRNYEFDGSGVGDRDVGPERIEGKCFLITFAEREVSSGIWSGHHLSKDKKSIEIDKAGLVSIADRAFCSIRLPTVSEIKKARKLPNPIFFAAVTENDKGMELPAARWVKLGSDVVPLEDELDFG